MKFKKDTMEEIKKDIKKSAQDTRLGMDMAYDAKRKKIEDIYIPDGYKEILTPEEMARAEKVGLVIGAITILAVIIGVVWWLAK